MHRPPYSLHYLRQQIGKEDNDDSDRGYIADQKPEDAEDSGVGAEF